MFSPSQVPAPDKYAVNIAAMERLGFKVKLGANFYKDTYGYTASAEERAADLNALVADDEVEMVLFSGGEGAAEILPLIDYENIRRHPKIFSSYSDGTSILNAIHAQTGLVTYYGTSPGVFADLRYYDCMQFFSHFVEGHEANEFFSDSAWKTLSDGTCSGTLTGGYISLVGLMQSSPYFSYDASKKYLLFLEDHEFFSEVGAVAEYLAFIGQSPFMQNVTGLIFGHYCVDVPDTLLRCLERFGKKHGIPVVYTDDFGHGTRHAIFPIGVDATLDATKQTLTFHGIN
jgi:muramoyltetrapeptide carboxypeptidase